MVANTPNTKEEQDYANSPEQRAKALHDAEQKEAFNRDFEDPERLAKDGIPGDLAGGARAREDNPNANWKTTVEGLAAKTAQLRGIRVGGRKGPLALILTIIFGGGLTFGGLFSALGLLPIHVGQMFTEKYDSQNTSMTIRTNKILYTKITKETTSGSCNVVKIACRYSRPSNKLLTNLARNGIQAVNKDGTPSKSSALFPNERPATYRFTDTKGKVINVPAKDFANTFKTNAAFRAAFHAAYTPRFVGFADSIFEKIKTRFSFRVSDSLSDSKDKKDVNDKLAEGSKGSDTGAKGAKAAEAVIADQATELLEKEVKEVAKSGKGNAVGLIAGVACGLADIPGIISKLVRVYQMAQLVKYAATILTVVGAMKAGDATPEEVSAIGDLFTQTVDGKSAMDAFGMKYTLFGDTTPESDSYLNFSPGGNVGRQLSLVTQFTDSPEKKAVCKVATNPATGAAIDIATSETLLLPLINLGAGLVLSTAMQELLPPAIGLLVTWLKDTGVLGSLMNYFLGDLTKDLLPDGVGNAFASGVSNLMGQTANAGANMPLTVTQKLAYNKATKEVQLAYAEEDRATLSPLDGSNPNTMLGSLVRQIVPYYSKLSSLSGVVSTIGNIVSGSVSRLASVSAAEEEDPAQYQLCEDPLIKNNDIAAGPFCNIEYGIPVEYLDKDPEAVLSAVADQIDSETGEPIEKDNALTELDPTRSATGSLSGWISLCTDGTTANADKCKITPETADYALYVMDHRIQQTMDGEDKVLEGEFPDSGGSTNSGTSNTTDAASITVVINKKHPLSPKEYIPAELGDIGGGKLLRSEAAAAYGKMASAASSAGSPISPVSAYRSYSTQVDVYNGWVADLGQAGADLTSARPGFSEHQTGLAVDISSLDKSFADTPAGKWLAANAYQYGFILRYPNGQTATTGYEFEPWHYRYVGISVATDMYKKGSATLEDYFKVSGGDYAYNKNPNSVAVLNRRYGLI